MAVPLKSIVRKLLIAINLNTKADISLTTNMKFNPRYSNLSTYYIVNEWLDKNSSKYIDLEGRGGKVTYTCSNLLEVMEVLQQLRDEYEHK